MSENLPVLVTGTFGIHSELPWRQGHLEAVRTATIPEEFKELPAVFHEDQRYNANLVYDETQKKAITSISSFVEETVSNYRNLLPGWEITKVTHVQDLLFTFKLEEDEIVVVTAPFDLVMSNAGSSEWIAKQLNAPDNWSAWKRSIDEEGVVEFKQFSALATIYKAAIRAMVNGDIYHGRPFDTVEMSYNLLKV